MSVMRQSHWTIVSFLLLGVLGTSQQDGAAEKNLQSYAPEHGDYFNLQDWRAITTSDVSPMEESQGWTAMGTTGGEASSPSVGEGNGEMKRTRRRKNRRRRKKQQPQQSRPYLPDLEDGEGGTTPDHKAYRRPYSQAKQQQANEDEQDDGIADIKSLLKQSGGLSLSEVLQQSNLSLADLLTGKQQAISALKMTDQIKVTSEDTETEIIDIDENGEHVRTRIPGHNKATKQHIVKKTMSTPDRQFAISTIQISETDLSDDVEEQNEDKNEEEKPKIPTRLPPVRKPLQNNRENTENEDNDWKPQRRRLPQSSSPRRNKYRNQNRQHETTTEENIEMPIYEEPISSRNADGDNIIDEEEIMNEESRNEETRNEETRNEETRNEETTEPTNISETVNEQEHEEEEEMDEPMEEDEEITTIITTSTTTSTTTTSTTTATPKVTTSNPRNRLSLKPRLRLPPSKHKSQRITPVHQRTPSDEEIEIPKNAIQINLDDLTGTDNVVSKADNTSHNEVISETTTTTTTEIPSSTTTTRRNVVMRRKSTQKPKVPFEDTPRVERKKIKEPSAKDEILEVLTDSRGGEKLARILADRNMSLGELVEQRERGSSQLHLADIFHNSSKEPNIAEPFLAKSMIEPISKEIYPLKALLEANLRQKNNKQQEEENKNTHPNNNMPISLKDTNMATQMDLGIITLFDKFSEIGIHPKDIKPSDIKTDSDGSSYFTSVISVKPTNEIYRESRNNVGFKSSNKQVSEIFSSLPTYINSEEVVNAKVVPDWSMGHQPQGEDIKGNEIERDLDGDGLIVLGDLQPLDDFNISPGASRSKYNKEEQGHGETNTSEGFRSAIIVSGAIVGSSIVIFLTILVGCRVRQTKRRRRVLQNQGGGIETIGGRKLSLHTSRSASPILPHPFSSPLTSHHYQWDSLKKPFQ